MITRKQNYKNWGVIKDSTEDEVVEVYEPTAEENLNNSNVSFNTWVTSAAKENAEIWNQGKTPAPKPKIDLSNLWAKATTLLKSKAGTKDKDNVLVGGQNTTPPKKDNTLLYVGIGVGSLAVIGIIIGVAVKVSKSNAKV